MKLNNNQVAELEDSYLAQLYAKRPIAVEKGQGVYLWDTEGNKYLDLVGGHGVAILGHSHPKYLERLIPQLEQLIINPGIFYNQQRAELGKRLAAISPKGLTTSFLSNSGTEAIEASIKLARRASKKPQIISFKGGFHGRTLGSLAATWNPKYRKPFDPCLPGFVHVKFGDIQELKQAISEETGAVIVEPIQGETGVVLPPPEFLKELREITIDKDILLIVDEVQTGFGRTGKMFAVEHWGITPDILCTAKGIAGGIPMGATISRPDIFSHLKIGEHSSTFGGNPIACAAANITIDLMKEERLLENCTRIGKYFLQQLHKLEELSSVREARGLGFMLALELRFRQTPFVKKAIKHNLLLLTSGLNVIRMLPPLIMQKEEVDDALGRLQQVLSEERS